MPHLQFITLLFNLPVNSVVFRKASSSLEATMKCCRDDAVLEVGLEMRTSGMLMFGSVNLLSEG